MIALGGNVGDARATIERAIFLLCDGIEINIAARSSDYTTPPWGVTDQPAFINAAIAVETSLSPQDLLARGHAVERMLGRDRAKEQRWGPRAVDIDLIAYGDVSVDTPELKLPHLYWAERAFVLVPLAEIAPDRIIGGVRVADALARVDAAGIDRLPPR